MKKIFSSRRLFSLAFFIVVITNIIVLTVVAFNKSNITSQLTLSERELKLPDGKNKENTGLSRQLVWRCVNKDFGGYFTYLKQPSWLNDEKLDELGLNLKDRYLKMSANTAYYKRILSTKEVFIVLEHNGEIYRETVREAEMDLEEAKNLLKTSGGDKYVKKDSKTPDINNTKLQNRVKRLEDHLKRERETYSRLFAIDAGLNYEKLREKYSDQTRFAIVKGLISTRFDYFKQKVLGSISKLSIKNIHVPLKYRQDMYPGFYFNVVLAYGSRYAPWIVSVHPINK